MKDKKEKKGLVLPKDAEVLTDEQAENAEGGWVTAVIAAVGLAVSIAGMIAGAVEGSQAERDAAAFEAAQIQFQKDMTHANNVNGSIALGAPVSC